MDDQEKSESGAPIYRYENIKKKDFTPPSGEGDMEAISDHIEKYVGKIDGVFHEIISDLIHIDIHYVYPSENFPFYTFVTSGMSDLAMNVPQGIEGYQYAELCFLLPESWFPKGTTLDSMNELFKDEKIYWPIRWMKILARFPHQYNTWLAYGHTIPNGEQANPFTEGTKLGCMLLMPNISIGPDFSELKISDEKTIHFYCLYPIYKEEMDFKLKNGLDDLIDKFEKIEFSDVLNLQRANACAKKKGFW